MPAIATPRAPRPALMSHDPTLWAHLSWEDLRDRDRSRTVAILPVGAVEAHGPHLPLGTDVIIARAMAREGALRLSEAGWDPLILPPIWYTPAPFARDFPGTISVRPETLTHLLEDVVAGLAHQGVRALVVANAHLDPANLGVLEGLARADREDGPDVVFPNLTRRSVAERLTEEFRTGACHAGRFEGSIVDAEAPELVRQEVARALPANPRSLSDAIREGKRSFREAGGERAYFGWPAESTALEGVETVQLLGRILAESVLERLGS